MKRKYSYGIFALFLSHLAIVLFLLKPGYVSIDEGVYHLMADAFFERQSFEIDNGYREFPSPAFQIQVRTAKTLRIHEGGLFPQYPSLSAVLSYPFYAVWGYRGLFVLNALSFWAVLFLCYRLSFLLFRDKAIAQGAILFLGLGTYAWEYSFSAWPHMFSLLFVVGSIFLALKGVCENKTSLLSLSGLVLGVGLGVRCDVVFAGAAVLSVFFYCGRFREALLCLLGSAPGVLLVSWVNYLKFGKFVPLTYGRGEDASPTTMQDFLPVLALCGVCLFVAWALSSRKVCEKYWLGASIKIAALCLSMALVLICPEHFLRVLSGTYSLVVNFTEHGLRSVEEGVVQTTRTGSVVYLGGVKKALLQSMPYLPIALLPFMRLFRSRDETSYLWVLISVPLVYIISYSYFSWHGGRCLNMRYFLPCLPFLSILCARACAELPSLSKTWAIRTVLISVLVFLGFLILPISRLRIWELQLLVFPLIIAFMLLVLVSKVLLSLENMKCKTLLLCGVVFAFTWSFLGTLTQDFLLSNTKRAVTYNTGKALMPYIERNSLVCVSSYDSFFGLMVEKGVHLYRPQPSGTSDLSDVSNFYLKKGRKVYIYCPNQKDFNPA